MELAEALSPEASSGRASSYSSQRKTIHCFSYASLRRPYPDSDSSISTGETRTMIQWLFSIFTPPANPYPISSASVFMTGVC
jgi:hypothetical protein